MTSKNNMATRYATTHESGRVLRQPDEAPQLTNLERQETDATTLTLHGEIIQKILWNQTRQAQNRHGDNMRNRKKENSTQQKWLGTTYSMNGHFDITQQSMIKITKHMA